MQLEEELKVVWLMVLHQVLNGEDGGEVSRNNEDDNWQGRQRRFTWNILSEISGEGDGRELRENEVGEGNHGGRGG